VNPDVKILLSENGLQMKWSKIGEKIVAYEKPMNILAYANINTLNLHLNHSFT
jgi:hypothetical protein